MNQTTNYLIPTLLIALFTLLVGCGDPDRKPLVGVWKIKDPVKVEKRVGEEDSSFDENRMTLEFRGGGKLITSTRLGLQSFMLGFPGVWACGHVDFWVCRSHKELEFPCKTAGWRADKSIGKTGQPNRPRSKTPLSALMRTSKSS